jgi:hypothetical protein
VGLRDRLVALGARRVDIGQGEQTWVVLHPRAGVTANEQAHLPGRLQPARSSGARTA